MRPATLALLALLAAYLPSTIGRRSYLSQLPNGQGQPAIGHKDNDGNKGTNQFGKDFKSAGKKWTTELCKKDSDGDGRTNGEELGDPSCVWTPGAEPEFTTGITNPGVADGAKASAETNPAAKPAKCTRRRLASWSWRRRRLDGDEDDEEEEEEEEEYNAEAGGGGYDPAVEPQAADVRDPCAAIGLQPVEGWVIAHAILTVLGWVVLLPAGIFVASPPGRRLVGAERWFNVHLTLQVTGTLFALFGALIAVYEVGLSSGTHALLGTALTAVLLVHPFAALLRPKGPAPPPAPTTTTAKPVPAQDRDEETASKDDEADKRSSDMSENTSSAGSEAKSSPEEAKQVAKAEGPSRARRVWNAYHKVFGYGLVLLALVEIVLGFLEISI